MTLRARNPSSPQWPFWLLLAAWFCVNVPQGATLTVLTWMAESRSFTHQQRLTQDVARLLVGQKPTSPIAEAVPRAQKHLPVKLPVPIAPEAMNKKIELSLESTCEVLPTRLRADHREDFAWICPESWRGEPPHEPPRVSLARFVCSSA